MFVLKEVFYQLRRKKQTAILILAAVLLIGCMTFYLGNIHSAEVALSTLGEKIPVTVKCMSPDGSTSTGLFLNAEHCDRLAAAGVQEIQLTAAAAGAFTDAAKQEQPFQGGDLPVIAANSLSALHTEAAAFSPELEQDFLAGQEAVCAVREDFAELHHIEPGDEVSFPLYLHPMGSEYREISPNATLTVQAVYPKSSGISGQMLVPAAWMRGESEKNGVDFFCYDSYSAVVADPLRLNDFKEKAAEAGFAETSPDPADNYAEALIFDDELFIKSAVKLEENLIVYRRFFLPFFALIVVLTSLVIFLVLRSDRRSIAVASSLGCPKSKNAVSRFCAVLLIDIAGCGLALPLLLWLTELSLLSCLAVCGAFLLCTGIGTALAMAFLLRFDTLELLTKVD